MAVEKRSHPDGKMVLAHALYHRIGVAQRVWVSISRMIVIAKISIAAKVWRRFYRKD
ncbi:hypothetical protein ACQKKX_09105 [Neorhizobium sp. NPDC001467]|uniref:hypothetical protein n=1 Tax=Neorhizobium sp. NPDC001467 TaxID=3390595 RepID=UPI003D049502